MTKRIFCAGLLVGIATTITVYALQPASAVALPQATTDTWVGSPFPSLELSYPVPQEPMDRTPITPTETVGAAPYEPS